MDELQTHMNPTFQQFSLEDNDYSSSSFFVTSPKESVSLHDEMEYSGTVVKPVMVTDATNIEEQPVSMKAVLDKLLKEGVGKYA